MAIIFGWGGGTPKDLGPAVPYTCPNCRNQGFFRYFIARKWFRLYFIPVVPYESRHLLVCPVCTGAIELTGEERSRAAAMVKHTTSWNSGQISDEQYGHLVGAFMKNEPLELPATPQELPSGPLEPTVDKPIQSLSVPDQVGLLGEDNAGQPEFDGDGAQAATIVDDDIEDAIVVEEHSVDQIDLPAPPATDLRDSPEAPAGFCTVCGARRPTADARFCHQCGSVLSGGGST
jgi:hypothetical protein